MITNRVHYFRAAFLALGAAFLAVPPPAQAQSYAFATTWGSQGNAAPFSTPEDRDLTRIQQRFATDRPARIIGQGGTQVVNSPRITPEGVAWLAPSAAWDGNPARTHDGPLG